MILGLMSKGCLCSPLFHAVFCQPCLLVYSPLLLTPVSLPTHLCLLIPVSCLLKEALSTSPLSCQADCGKCVRQAGAFLVLNKKRSQSWWASKQAAAHVDCTDRHRWSIHLCDQSFPVSDMVFFFLVLLCNQTVLCGKLSVLTVCFCNHFPPPVLFSPQPCLASGSVPSLQLSCLVTCRGTCSTCNCS